jgi:membrane protein YdbS with pleckstrin-like domain
MNCGGQVPTGARFCAGCGAVVDTEATRLAPPSARTPLADSATTPTAQTFFNSQTPQSVLQRRESHPPTPPSRGATEDVEKIIFVVRPTLLFVGLGYVAAALGAVLLVILLTILPLEISPLISIPLALALLLIPAYYHILRNRVQYTLTDSKIIIDRGLISRTTTNIPLGKIQNVTVSATAMQRLLRFGDVVLDDASEQTAQVVLDNIPDPRGHADLLLRQLRRPR